MISMILAIIAIVLGVISVLSKSDLLEYVSGLMIMVAILLSPFGEWLTKLN